MAITLISSYLYVFLNETCKKKEIINIFGKFVSKEVLDKLIKNMKNFELKTEKKKITVLRCDIANFNELSKIYELDEIIDKLNATFKIITEKIFKYNGTIDKCISDSIVAHWGDPIANANDSMSAVKAAVEIIEAVDDYNISCEGEKIKFDIKVAVNTGDAIVGPIGSDKLNEYTILGDTVNIAQRIGQICSQLDNRFMISESTYNEVQNIINADYSGIIKIKGREESVKVYAPKLEQKND
jgi:adenylate cyclase